MTNFQYRNNEQINKMATQAFGKIGGVVYNNTINLTVDGYKYLLAYCIVSGKEVNSEACETIRKISICFTDALRNKVFFEKAKDGRDFIYFDEYMKELEASAEFSKTWAALQEALTA